MIGVTDRALTSLQLRLATAVAETLRVPPASLRVTDSFAALGMDSLMAVELTAAIDAALGIELPMTAVHEYSNVESLSGFIERGASETSHDALVARMMADAVLPDDIMPARDGRARLTRNARHVLLTGATGFVGAFLLRALVDETDAVVHCLVRLGDGTPGRAEGSFFRDAALRARLERHLLSYGLWDDELAGRVRIVSGDLSAPRLGMSDDDYDWLATNADAIYHAGADVNWVQGYDALRAVNVIGTREVVRLACHRVATPVHFVSSVGVAHSTTGPRHVDERTDALAASNGLRLGYAQSKCVAEALVRAAGDRGLPVTIIRPALVSGDSRTGRSNVDDLIARFIAGCIRMHAAPDLDWRLDCVPVDEVAGAIVRLARAHEHGVSVAHIIAERPRHWRECVLWMRLSGYDVELLPYREWTEVLRATDDATHPLHPLRSFFLHTIAAEDHLTLPELFEEHRRAHVGGAATRRTLERLGNPSRALDFHVLSRYFDDFVLKGVIPDTSARRSAPASTTRALDVYAYAPRLVPNLREWTGDPSLQVESLVTTPLPSDDSIVAELTSWRAGTRAGLYRAVASCSGAAARTVPLFVKSKPADRQVIEVAEGVAALASPALGETVTRFRDHLGLTNSHIREIALYEQPDRRLRDHAPRVFAAHRDDNERSWTLILESVDDAVLINAADTTARWIDAAIDAALVGLAKIHSVWYGRTAELARQPWMAPGRDAHQRVEMMPLWSALADHAAQRSSAWGDARLRRLHAQLVADVSSWAAELDAQPLTLIHNDFNPRNIAIRRAGDELKLCAFDWELATVGVPQRDVAELFAFVLPPDAPLATVSHWLERSRSLLEVETGTRIERAAWSRGFNAALCDLLVDRLSFYAMIDRVRPQQFLPRVVRSWSNLHRYYPWS